MWDDQDFNIKQRIWKVIWDVEKSAFNFYLGVCSKGLEN